MLLISLNFFISYTAGITLSLFGGVQKHSTDKNKVPVRGDIHVLVVGEDYLFPALAAPSFLPNKIMKSFICVIQHNFLLSR